MQLNEMKELYDTKDKQLCGNKYIGTGRSDGLVECATCHKLVNPLVHFKNSSNDTLYITKDHEEYMTETNSVHENEIAICCTKCGASVEECVCHKPVERITRDEAIRIYEETDLRNDVPLLERIFDYIEYLEDNQKEK